MRWSKLAKPVESNAKGGKDIRRIRKQPGRTAAGKCHSRPSFHSHFSVCIRGQIVIDEGDVRRKFV